jgi:hypothetical protein
MPPVPPTFNERCRDPGLRWLAAHPPNVLEKLPNYWREFIPDLCAGFNDRCGYLAMLDYNGTVDHFRSTKKNRTLAYDWSNYRYATGWLNSSKQTLDEEVLDPLAVREEWFEIDLASLHLRLTPAVPARLRAIAGFTIRRLKLNWRRRIIFIRQKYFSSYSSGEFPLDYLQKVAPLLATAVRREKLLSYLSLNNSIARRDVGGICGVSASRGGELATIWRLAGHLVAQGRGRNVWYRRT